MRKILTLAIATFALNGCIMSGPMALLPPTAKFIMWTASDKDENDSDENKSISVQQLLQNVRGFSSDKPKPEPIHIAYNDYVLTDDQLERFSKIHTRTLEMVCGPYEYGSPLDAASMALRTCGAIKSQMVERGLNLVVRFNPNGPKGVAIINPMITIEENDA